MDAHRCPICDRRFSDKGALFNHMAHTKKHISIFEELWRLRFLLAETEREKEIYRQQRDDARLRMEWVKDGFDLARFPKAAPITSEAIAWAESIVEKLPPN